MSQHYEWAKIHPGGFDQPVIVGPGKAEDAYGSTNDLDALVIGECVIEGTPDNFRWLAQAILATFPEKPEETEYCPEEVGDGWGCVLPAGHDGIHKSDEDDPDGDEA